MQLCRAPAERSGDGESRGFRGFTPAKVRRLDVVTAAMGARAQLAAFIRAAWLRREAHSFCGRRRGLQWAGDGVSGRHQGGKHHHEP